MAHTRRYFLEIPSANGNGERANFEGISAATISVAGTNNGTMKLQASNDGANWTDMIASLTNNAGPEEITPLPVRFMRINVSGYTAGDSTSLVVANDE